MLAANGIWEPPSQLVTQIERHLPLCSCQIWMRTLWGQWISTSYSQNSSVDKSHTRVDILLTQHRQKNKWRQILKAPSSGQHLNLGILIVSNTLQPNSIKTNTTTALQPDDIIQAEIPSTQKWMPLQWELPVTGQDRIDTQSVWGPRHIGVIDERI